MSEEIPEANPPLGEEEKSAVAKLTTADLKEIDAAILAESCEEWYKVARVVSIAEKVLKPRYPKLSYIFFARRLAELAEQGKLESQGNIEYMRFSEVRIPAASENGKK